MNASTLLNITKKTVLVFLWCVLRQKHAIEIFFNTKTACAATRSSARTLAIHRTSPPQDASWTL